MPRLREDQQPDAVIDLRHRSLQRAPTDEVVLVDDGPADLPPAPVFTHEPVVLDAARTSRKRRRVAELEEIAAANARAAVEARAVALEQRGHLEAAIDAWRTTASELADLRRDLKGFAAARADLIARERGRAEQMARTDVEVKLQRLVAGNAELQAEIDRLRNALAEQQGLNGDGTQRLRDEQRKRAEAEKEAQRAIAAYETAERRLETVSEALHRRAADEQARIEAAEAARAAAEAELAALGGGGQVATLTDRVEDLVIQLGELDAELVGMESRAVAAEAQAAKEHARAESAETAVTDIEGALASTRNDAEAATDRATVARVRLDEIVHERDALLAAIATLELDAEERERRVADDAARAVAARELADAAGLEEALVAARFEAETLRGETTALAAQLEEAWSQVEAARRATPTDGTDPDDAADMAVDAESIDARGSVLDAFAELAATPAMADHADDDDDILDARRAALRYLNSLARDVSTPRPHRN
jgi:chromosome segregation ATPase